MYINIFKRINSKNKLNSLSATGETGRHPPPSPLTSVDLSRHNNS